MKQVLIPSGRVIVASGLPEEKGCKTEIIDLVNPTLRLHLLSDTPPRWGAIGGLVGNKPVIGGGYVIDDYFQDYFVIGEHDKKDKKLMSQERYPIIILQVIQHILKVKSFEGLQLQV